VFVLVAHVNDVLCFQVVKMTSRTWSGVLVSVLVAHVNDVLLFSGCQNDTQ